MIEMSKNIVGKCPKCGAVLTGNDITDVRFKTKESLENHYPHAFVCNKCGYIMGFGVLWWKYPPLRLSYP